MFARHSKAMVGAAYLASGTEGRVGMRLAYELAGRWRDKEVTEFIVNEFLVI